MTAMPNRYSTASLARHLGVDRDTAYALITFLRKTRCIREVGVEPPPSGKGRGATVYEVQPESLTAWARQIGAL